MPASPTSSTTSAPRLAGRSVSRPSSSDAGWDLVNDLLGEALALLEQDPGAARRCIESARSLVRVPAHEDRAKKCRLADWQVRRAKDFICNNLGSNLRIEGVARTVHLSSGYFSRAFKSTTGFSYSNFVARARIDLAKQLLLGTELPISEVALACGLADQSHLTRIFNRVVGLPPNAWRRRILGDVFADRAIAGGSTHRIPPG
jgi:AraC-like DNA-binding protein